MVLGSFFDRDEDVFHVMNDLADAYVLLNSWAGIKPNPNLSVCDRFV